MMPVDLADSAYRFARRAWPIMRPALIALAPYVAAIWLMSHLTHGRALTVLMCVTLLVGFAVVEFRRKRTGVLHLAALAALTVAGYALAGPAGAAVPLATAGFRAVWAKARSRR